MARFRARDGKTRSDRVSSVGRIDEEQRVVVAGRIIVQPEVWFIPDPQDRVEHRVASDKIRDECVPVRQAGWHLPASAVAVRPVWRARNGQIASYAETVRPHDHIVRTTPVELVARRLEAR